MHQTKPMLYVGLDTDDRGKISQIAEIARQGAHGVLGLKFGPRLLLCDQSYLGVMRELPVFVDCKFFDIPETTYQSVKHVKGLGAEVCTVHALTGQEALKRVAELEGDGFSVACVTILTSFSQATLPKVMHGETKSIADLVSSLAYEAYESGLRTFVCAPEEAPKIRELGTDVRIITPGIRLSEQRVTAEDQKRVCTPMQAKKLGADALVMGRPIVNAHDPQEVIKEVVRVMGDS